MSHQTPSTPAASAFRRLRRLAVAVAILGVAGSSACRRTYVVDIMPAEAGARQPSVVDIHPLPREQILSLPPERAERGFQGAGAVAVSADGCWVAVADQGRRELHIFGPSGEYETTIEGAGPEPSLLSSITSLAFSASGELLVGDGVGLRVLALVPDSWRVRRTVPVSAAAERQPLASLWAAPNGTWFSYDEITPLPFITAMPAVSGWTPDGARVGYWGALRTVPGGGFTAVLGGGSLAGIGDTLFALRHLTGELDRYSVTRPSAVPVVEERLPLLFHPPALRHDRIPIAPAVGRARPVFASRHVAELNADRWGHLFFLQFRDPIVPGEILPADRRTVLVGVSKRGNDFQYFDLGGQAIALGVGGEHLAAVLRDTARAAADSDRVVALFRNPMLPSGTDPEGPSCRT